MVCTRRGGAIAPIAGCAAPSRSRAISTALKSSRGEEALTLYLFNTQSAKHFFCSKCGIYTHHQRRSIPTQFGVNVACLEGLSPFDFDEVPVLNGLAHPGDHREGPRASRVGVLKFVPEPAAS